MSRKTHRFAASEGFVDDLEGEHRRKMIPLASILPVMSIRPDDSVVDLGAGVGYFTFPIARICSEIIAVDIEPKMLSVLRTRVAENGHENVSLLRAELTALPLAESSVDKVLAAFVYHEVDSQKNLLGECHRILKPTGQLTVIDFQKRLTGEGPPIWVRKRPKHVLSTGRGMFELLDRRDTKTYYQLRLKKL